LRPSSGQYRFTEKEKLMNTTTLTLEIETRQEPNEKALTPSDRRQVLGASLRLLGHRLGTGKPILRDDVVRLAKFADDSQLESTS
jgi:hypothetical protein